MGSDATPMRGTEHARTAAADIKTRIFMDYSSGENI
jgi:hypothetical protein